jgi:uncharacterized LabA/DUF88 family protein
MAPNDLKTILYIDGFNLYYGCLRKTPYRWLNLEAFADLLLPANRIVGVKYFTAKVGARASEDPGKPRRQEVYLRALSTLPRVQVILGSFLSKPHWMPLADSAGSKKPQFVQVIRTEEKGSDVNIAAHLIHDGHRGTYEAAALVTNDSDLAEAIRIVRHEIGLPVVVFNPQPNKPSYELSKVASIIRPIRTHVLASAQFPDTIRDSTGRSITKPTGW